MVDQLSEAFRWLLFEQEAEEARTARNAAQEQLQRATSALDESTNTLVRVTGERDTALQDAKKVSGPCKVFAQSAFTLYTSPYPSKKIHMTLVF